MPPLQHAPSVEDARASSGIASVLGRFRSLNRSTSSQPITPLPATASSASLSSNQPTDVGYFGGPPNRAQLLAQLQKGQPIDVRTAAAEEFKIIVNEYSLSSVMEIWYAAQDLLNPEYPQETRQAAFRLLTTCIKHAERSSLDRLHFYKIIVNHPLNEDFDDQLQALITLTNNGKNLNGFEREIAQLLSRWLRHWFRDAAAARQTRKREGTSSAGVSAGEFNLKQTFKFVDLVIKTNFYNLEEREVDAVLLDIITICKRTTSKEDISEALSIFQDTSAYGYIPQGRLPAMVEVLCGTYATIRDLAEKTWEVVDKLCQGYLKHSTVLVLRDILDAPSRRAGRNSNSLRGAVYFMERFLLSEDPKLPKVDFAFVMGAFKSALAANSARLELDICRAISNVLASPATISKVTQDELSVSLDILAQCSLRTTERMDGTPLYPQSPDNLTPKAHTKSVNKEEFSLMLSQTLFTTINELEGMCSSPEFEHTDVIVEFFVKVHRHIPDSCAEIIVDYYNKECLLYPSCSDWLKNCQTLITVVFNDRTRPANMRLGVLSAIKQLHETIRDICDEDSLRRLIDMTFEHFYSEQDLRVLEALIRIAIDVSVSGSFRLYENILHLLITFTKKASAPLDENRIRPLPGSRPSSIAVNIPYVVTPTNMVTRGLVKIFIRVMNRSAVKAVRAFEELVKIAGFCPDLEARLTAMRLLFRIRCDAENAIYLIKAPDSDAVAEALGRLVKNGDETASSSPLDDSTSSRSGRSNSLSQSSFLFRTASRTNLERSERQRPRPPMLWSYPEKTPHPEPIPDHPSPVLFLYQDDNSGPASSTAPHSPDPDHDPDMEILTNGDVEEDEDTEGKPATAAPNDKLHISLWLEQIIPVIQKGADWEICSYVLVHTAPQLANRTMFKDCKPHILLLRALICDQLHTNRIPNGGDLPVEIKKADIAVALIGLLTTLIGYHNTFARNESEAIVKAFQLGLHSWQRTAKPCIHGITICCYELPIPTSKFLSGILTKLSQIITTAAVSVHILEFLLVLARLPNLYANFTEPDFRNVFGIAFRYIQHTKETAHAPSRTSYPGRVGTKDALAEANQPFDQPELPQYVLTLAYNVLTTWFLALRISERPKYVPWIIRGLVLVPDGVDEQSQACIDMLQRFTYSDVDLAAPPGWKSTGDSKNVVTKSWLMSSASILTVSTETNTGLTHLVVRKPTGTSHFTLMVDKPEPVRIDPQRDSAWFAGDTAPDVQNSDSALVQAVMPSHLILQLTAGAGTPEGGRPILLPDDEKTQRALQTIDHIPVVDFHKIGVVYVGPNQTNESDILSNTMGSADYADFVDGLGKLVKLKGSKINTGGLDREADGDGTHAYFWADKVTEVIFHVTTMMPTNLEHDSHCINKKRHIGNDFVNVIFNNSGRPYAFHTIPAQFAFFNVVITPEAKVPNLSTTPEEESRDIFYRVKLQQKPGLPNMSAAAETKLVSGKSLPAFVRNLALNASIFSHVRNEGGGEHVSFWRHRLRSINRLRERTLGPTAISPSFPGGPQPPSAISGPNSRRISAATFVSDGGSLRSASTAVNGEWPDETEATLDAVDFSRWT